MFSGYKPAEHVPPGQEISGSRLLTAAILVAVITCLLLLLLRFAPPAGLSSF
jgi:hypothetical protein